MGLFILQPYPISIVSVIDLSSESTCTCLYGMKAPDGVFCLRNSTMSCCGCLWGISSNVNSSRLLSNGVSHSCQLPLMAQEGLDKGSLAFFRSS